MGIMQLDRTIYNADNLLVMSRLPSDSVDLIYLDPPFNTGRQFKNPIKVNNKKAIASFEDTWTLADIHEDERDILALRYPGAAEVIKALALTNGGSWSAYLTYMGVRLVQMRRILKPTGSIYYHCDPTMSHGVKLMMDAIFGKSNFRSEFIWHYAKIGVASNKWTANTDHILFYTKSDNYNFTPLTHDQPNEIHTRFAKLVRNNKLLYGDLKRRKDSITQSKIRQAQKRLGRELRDDDVIIDFNDEANKKRMDNVHKIPFLKGNAAERIGHPTEKPIALLKRIVEASSRPNDMVLDPFCGCGVTAAACELFFDKRRKWVGIDFGTDAAEILTEKLNKCAAHLFGADKLPKVNTLDESDLPPLRPIPDKAKMKAMLYKGQGGKCNGCLQTYSTAFMDIDHLLPRAKGGDNDIANLQLLCKECNTMKGQKTMNELHRRIALIAAERIEEKAKEYREKGAKRLAKEKEKAIAKAEKQKRMI
ncbi:MAG: DNA methyltransferase [Gammaproteobacteria bacterium]